MNSYCFKAQGTDLAQEFIYTYLDHLNNSIAGALREARKLTEAELEELEYYAKDLVEAIRTSQAMARYEELYDGEAPEHMDIQTVREHRMLTNQVEHEVRSLVISIEDKYRKETK